MAMGAGNTGAMSGLPPLTAADALTSWQFAPVVSAVLLLLAAAYLAGVRVVGRRHPARPWPAGRTAAFLLGLTAVAVATQSSIGVYDDVLFSMHMIQHLLLIMVAPPLLIYGRPVTLLMHAARNPLHTRVKGVLRSSAVSGLTCRPAAAALYAAVAVSTHLTPLMNFVLENEAVHDAEHAPGRTPSGRPAGLDATTPCSPPWAGTTAGRRYPLIRGGGASRPARPPSSR
jgi:cytochrome c oxidase assembly factor CtaG